MYRDEVEKLKVAVSAIDVLVEGTSNILMSVDSISLNIEPLQKSLDSLLYSRQNLIAQLAILKAAQLEAQELALITEQ